MGRNNNKKNLLMMIISILSTFFPTSFPANDGEYYLGSTCLNMTHKLSNKFFHENLVYVFSQLTQNAPLPQNKNRGFYYLSRGVGADKAYGLAQCRQDISQGDCHFCVGQVSNDLLALCRAERTAIIWYNHCMVKYADADFFGKPDISKWVYYFIQGSTTGGPGFNTTAAKLMDQLHRNTLITPRRGMFYSTTAQVGGLYGMSQCNRDIIHEDCKNCITIAKYYLNWQINNFTHTYVGQRVAFVSCSIRFDNFKFY